MKKLLSILGLLAVLSSCNKDDNTDYFCLAVGNEDWSTVKSYLEGDAAGRGYKRWEQNAIEFAKIISDRTCVDTAYALLNYKETTPEETSDVIAYMIINDGSIVEKTIIITTNMETGAISCLGLK